MLYELIATVAAGFLGGGVAMLLRWLSRGQLPRFLVPTLAGLAMISFVIWSDYTWYGRSTAALPPSFEVFFSNSERPAWRPWTLLVPVTTRFAAVDHASERRNEGVPDQIMADVYLFARFVPTYRRTVLIDCAGMRRADVGEGTQFADDGAVTGANWTPLPPDDALAGAVCPST
jgi:hypothetical protein